RKIPIRQIVLQSGPTKAGDINNQTTIARLNQRPPNIALDIQWVKVPFELVRDAARKPNTVLRGSQVKVFNRAVQQSITHCPANDISRFGQISQRILQI